MKQMIAQRYLLPAFTFAVFATTIAYSGFIIFRHFSQTTRRAEGSTMVNFTAETLKSALNEVNVCNQNLMGRRLGQKLPYLKSEKGRILLQAGSVVAPETVRVQEIALENMATEDGGVKRAGGIGMVRVKVIYEITGASRSESHISRETWVPVKADSSGKIVACHLPLNQFQLSSR